MPEPLRVLIAGAGIGGLAAALSTARAGQRVQLFEKTSAFSEVGAGIQLGPNVTRILREWGLGSTLDRVACRPERLAVHDAASGALLASLPLGDAMVQRYGAPYVTVHRAALHGLLLDAVRAQGDVDLQMGWTLQDYAQDAEPGLAAVHTHWRTADGKLPVRHGDVLVDAQGLWSQPVSATGQGNGLRFTRHWAYRALLSPERLDAATAAQALPTLLQQVTLWLGPQMHVVAYPVRDTAGALLLNVVVLIEDEEQPVARDWGNVRVATLPAMAGLAAHGQLQSLWQAVSSSELGWQRWPLFALPPLRNAEGMAMGCVARLGDAAHPMLPYLAQGAGMAVEDAAALGQCLQNPNQRPDDRLAAYAHRRWRRNAQVQARAQRNAKVFHTSGLLRLGRDWALRRFGGRLLDQPWLYGGLSAENSS